MDNNWNNLQPWKIILGFLGLVILLLAVGILFSINDKIGQTLGGSAFDPSFSAATTLTATCGGTAPATIIQGTTTGRTSFDVTLLNHLTTKVQICRDSTCTTTTGHTLSSSSPAYTQNDSYFGPYSCAAVASTTVSGWASL